MLRLALAVCLALAPGIALAQTLPALHDVTGVAPDDVLNIRAEPRASSPIIGVLAPFAEGIEVVATNEAGTWGRVNYGEASGWASMRYLRARPIAFSEAGLPVGLACFGTEPFWSLSHDGSSLIHQRMGGGPLEFDTFEALATGIPDDLTRAISARAGSVTASAFVYPATCSDGMSDRVYGLAVGLVLDGPAGAELRTGCCTLAR